MNAGVAAAILVAGTLASGAPFFFKHAPVPLVFVAAHAAILFLCWRFARFAPWAATLAIAATAIVGAIAYPWSLTVAEPSSAPLALMEPPRRALAGLAPYANDGFAPASPGLAWSLLNAPATLLDAPWALTPIWAAIFVAVLARHAPETWRAPALVLLANPAMVQASAVGHDIWAVGFAMGSALLAFDARAGVVRGALLALILNARLPLVAVALARAVRAERRAAWSAVALGALALHGIVAAWTWSSGAFYEPAHLLGRASAAIGTAGLAMGAALWLAGLAALRRAEAPILWLWAMAPFAAIGFAELARDGAIATWEGKHYVGIGLPVAAAAWALAHKRRVM
jgi:hypothetical protein